MLSSFAAGFRQIVASAVGGMHGSSGQAEFWERKMLTHFHRLDLDKDGYVSRDDVKALVKRLTRISKLSEQREFTNQRLLIQLWEDFWCCGEDKGYDHKVSPDEFVAVVRCLLRLPDAKARLEEPLTLLFDVVDNNADGCVTPKEWVAFCEGLGLDADAALSSYRDVFGQGKEGISRDEFVHAGQCFFTYNDESHPSRLLWGPLHRPGK